MSMDTRRFLLFVTLSIIISIAKAQIRTNVYFDGYWGKWENQWLSSLFSSTPVKMYYDLYGDESGFIVYDKGDHPSQYVFKFQIDNYVQPTKQQKKEKYNKHEWYEYSGTVEYFVIEDNPTIKDILKKFGFPLYNKDTQDNNGNFSVKRVADATIKIAPYKKHPEVYNIWFDDVAVGISLVYVHF